MRKHSKLTYIGEGDVDKVNDYHNLGFLFYYTYLFRDKCHVAKISIKLSIQLRMTLTSYLCLIRLYSEEEKTTETGRNTHVHACAHTHPSINGGYE